MSLVEPRWMQHARTFERAGLLEIPGPKAHPTILSFFLHTTLKGNKLAESDETAWCSAFMCAVMEQTGVRSTRSAAARSWATWGVNLNKPRLGCIVVFDRPTPKNPKGAHVALYVGADGSDYCDVLGGNQANSVRVTTYKTADVIAYRYPIGEPLV